jgi:hypothetical protein
MKQLEIEFFWPLTEQIPLDLDFTPSIEYNRELEAKLYAAGRELELRGYYGKDLT